MAVAAKEIASAGKAPDLLVNVRESDAGTFAKSIIYAGLAKGFFWAGHTDEALLAVTEIEDANERLGSFTFAADKLINQKRISEARHVLEKALSQIPQTAVVDTFDRSDQITSLALLFVRIGDSDKALEFARSRESLEGRRLSHEAKLGPLSETIKSVVSAGEVGKAQNWLRYIVGNVDRFQASVSVAIGLIKNGQVEALKQFQSELLATKNKIHPNMVEFNRGFLDVALTDIAVELTRANQTEEALNLLKGVADESPRNKGTTRVAVELAKAGRQNEAFDIVDKINDRAARSKGIADVIVALTNANRGEQIQSMLERVEFGDDRSRSQSAMAKWQARNGHLRLARQTADSRTTPLDRLDAYVSLLIEYVTKHNPEYVYELKRNPKDDYSTVEISMLRHTSARLFFILFRQRFAGGGQCPTNTSFHFVKRRILALRYYPAG